MKIKNTLALVLLVGLTTVFSSCKKNKTGDLEVNVVDGFGNSVGSSRTVYLYFGVTNYDNGTYTKSALTNNSGQAQFYDLEPGDYYVDCDWENQLGQTMVSSGAGTVEAKKVTTITIVP